MSFLFLHPASLLVIAHTLLVVGLGVRVIMCRPATGVALAWLLLITLAPFGGALLYLLIGERRIGHRRVKEFAALRADSRKIAESAVDRGLTNVDWSRHSPQVRAMDRLGRALRCIDGLR